MNDSPETPPAAINPSIAKGIALGLGLLLIGGTALLITLLILREPELPPLEGATFRLQASEKVTDASLHENTALFVIERSDGSQRIVTVNLATGESTEILAQPE